LNQEFVPEPVAFPGSFAPSLSLVLGPSDDEAFAHVTRWPTTDYCAELSSFVHIFPEQSSEKYLSLPPQMSLYLPLNVKLLKKQMDEPLFVSFVTIWSVLEQKLRPRNLREVP